MLKVASPEKRKLIVTDTVFSMDGDTAYLRDLVKLKEKYGAIIIVDEAHASGIYGIGGAGLSHIEKDLAQKIDIHMGTFSKALGCYGAYLTGDAIYIEYLQNMMRSFVFTTALPPGALGAVQKAIEIVKEDNERRENLIANGAYFRTHLQEAGFDIGNSSTHIVPIVVGSNENALRFSERLQEIGIAAIAIRPPTVPVGSSRVRFAVTSQHTIADLKWAIQHIIRIGKEEGFLV